MISSKKRCSTFPSPSGQLILIFRANELCSRIDNEIAIVHKFVQDMYHDRFPELAGMVPEPIVFLKTVNILMNDIEKGILQS